MPISAGLHDRAAPPAPPRSPARRSARSTPATAQPVLARQHGSGNSGVDIGSAAAERPAAAGAGSAGGTAGVAGCGGSAGLMVVLSWPDQSRIETRRASMVATTTAPKASNPGSGSTLAMTRSAPCPPAAPRRKHIEHRQCPTVSTSRYSPARSRWRHSDRRCAVQASRVSGRDLQQRHRNAGDEHDHRQFHEPEVHSSRMPPARCGRRRPSTLLVDITGSTLAGT